MAFPVLLTLLAFTTPAVATGCFSGIFAFGDSYTDAGNYHRLYNDEYSSRIRSSPYGMTYFHHATGRFNDGRTILDFFSLALGLPFQPPHLGISKGYNAKQGVNFAVGGAAILNGSFFKERAIPNLWNYPLGVQIGKFKELLTSLCNSKSECREEVVGEALFLVGEIGINDFSYFLLDGRSPREAWTCVPYMTRALASAIDELIKLGAKRLVVPGIFPNGCTPIHLSNYYRTHGGTKKDDYDPENGCIWRVNLLSLYYNFKLQEALEKLRRQNPSATIIYADYYTAAMEIIESPEKFGFDKDKLRVCCGGGGPYNINKSATCGTPGATVCDDPSRAVFWGEYHFTDAANEVIAKSILEGPNAVPPITHACPKDRERAFSN